MKNIQKKRGFTIVELVIVIAVIAILAAVLIPTFSGIIKKANLSSDMQAVREMNVALAADEAIRGKAATLEEAMQVLANAGYNADSWVCLSKGYTVYWWSVNNRLVLYNASTAEVEYPTDFNIKEFVTHNDGGDFYIYDNHRIKAVETNISLGSASSETSGVTLGSLSSNTEVATTLTSQVALTAINNTLTSTSNNEVKTALGLNSNNSYAYGTKEITSATYGDNNNGAYAAMQIVAVGNTETPELKSNGEVKENLFYIQVNTTGNPTEAEIASAQKAAGDMVYAIFTQINTSQIEKDDVAIVLAPGTTIDVSDKEWSAVKEFEGYFGTTDASNPIVIDGAQLTPSTGYSQTVSFTGDNSKYFVTGFFGTVYGKTTIENVTFKNITLDKPANDFDIANYKINGKTIDSRNTIGIIGGITDNAAQKVANVVLRNIKVEASCDINCGASGGGLVGYIGSAETSGKLNGTVLIENCEVSTKVITNYLPNNKAYGPVGGIVGLLCRANNTTLTIKDCTFNGTVKGNTLVGGAIGNIITGTVTFTGTNNFSGATLIKGNNESYNKVGSVIGAVSTPDNLTLGGTITTAEGVTAAYYVGSDQYNLSKQKIN